MAANRALDGFSRADTSMRASILMRMYKDLEARSLDLTEVVVDEMGIAVSSATGVTEQAMTVLLDTARLLRNANSVGEIGTAG